MKQKSLSFFTLVSFALLSVAFADTVHAGRYELIKGKRVEVCEAYQKNLNSINHPYPMMCEREINAAMKDFKKPEWRKPSDEQAAALALDEVRLANKALGLPEPKKVTPRTEETEGWPRKNGLANVDIDNDGVPELVIKQQDGDCPMHRAFAVDIAVLTHDGMHYDLEKSQYIDAKFSRLVGQLNKDPKVEKRRPPGITDTDFWGYALYDVFLYKGVAYVDLWETGKNYPNLGSGRLHVLLRKDGTTREICAYRFK